MSGGCTIQSESGALGWCHIGVLCCGVAVMLGLHNMDMGMGWALLVVGAGVGAGVG
jgi:hypothetical protein